MTDITEGSPNFYLHASRTRDAESHARERVQSKTPGTKEYQTAAKVHSTIKRHLDKLSAKDGHKYHSEYQRKKGMDAHNKTSVPSVKTEETEIQELSKKTLGSYINKAAGAAADSAAAETHSSMKGKDKMADKHMADKDKRMKGIHTATKKLAKEETVHEDAATNCASAGAVAGIGVGPAGEPGKKKAIIKDMLRRKMKS